MTEVQPIVVPGASPINGHYCHAVVHGGVVYVSGQLGRGPGMSDEHAGDMRSQCRRSLESLAAILAGVGSDMSRLLKVTIYIPNIEHWPVVDEEYRRALGTHRPARAIVPVGRLHFGALIEIDAIAAL